ncbi:TPA: transmembrane anchor protein, partial [Pseudomonas aeruginosa]
MYNVSKPTLDDLPSSKQLLRSTLIALVAAIAILVGIVLPSEYAIDPTGIGR